MRRTEFQLSDSRQRLAESKDTTLDNRLRKLCRIALKLGWDAMAPDTSSKVRYLPSATLLDSISPAGMLLIDELARRCGGSRVRDRAILGLANPTAQQYSRHAQGAEPQQNALPHPHLILLMNRPAQPEPGTLRSNLYQCIRVLVSY